ncbi:MAG TPA: hypothetical protein DDZ88_24220 [Verrucomicrobiales bacterium]|nr:hypothetical protein [Verrucomicrobiales bacterium]
MKMKNPTQSMKNPFVILAVVAAVILGLVLYLANRQGTLAVMQLTVGWMLTLLVGVAGLTILWQIWIGKIDMSHLFSEGADGQASFSRFQFFIFTFVIAMCLFLVVIGDGTKPAAFPTDIPPGILMLLGISSGSYLVAKGIAEKDASPNPANAPGGGDAGNVPPPTLNPSAATLRTVSGKIEAQIAALGAEEADDAWTKELRANLKILLEASNALV